jgi:hypothetical protein
MKPFLKMIPMLLLMSCNGDKVEPEKKGDWKRLPPDPPIGIWRWS